MKPAHWLALSLTTFFGGASVLAWAVISTSRTSCTLMPAAHTASPPIVADQRRSNRPLPSVQVLVAKQKVPAWVRIDEPEWYFELVEMPQKDAPVNALHNFNEVRNRRLSRTLPEFGRMLSDMLVSPELDGMIAKLPPGMRAIALKVNAESVAGGFVLPGYRVDVVSTTRGSYERSPQIILQNMLVLAVDTIANRDNQTNSILGSTITLAATPEEAQRLSIAASMGELRLTLRSGTSDD